MQVKLTNMEVKDFLQDYKDRCEIEFLEEGSKEKNDLIESAKKRGILLEGSRDLGALKTIYLFTDKYNANGALVRSKEFQKVMPQLVGKPMNILHNRKLIVGFYIDYKYILNENKAIAYAIFFKSNYSDLWEKAKDLKKKGKLSSSFEIWAEKKDYNKDGSYILKNIELAGGALIFEEDGNEPAFKDAKVLAMAKKDLEAMVDEKCLVYASKYREDELITSLDGKIETVKVDTKEAPKAEIKKEEVKVELPKPEVKPKIKCSNCGEEFESGLQDNIKCPKCFAVVNRAGEMIYPPQIKDFRLLCPSCKINNWLILAKKEDDVDVRCLGCAKEYTFEFAKKSDSKVASDFQFLYTNRVHCLQCNTPIDVAGFSSSKQHKIVCKKCGLKFDYDVTHEQYRKIVGINEKNSPKENIDNLNKSSEKGGTEMAEEKKVEQASEHDFLEATEEKNKEEISKRLENADVKKDEAKAEEPKAEEPKPEKAKEEAPKAEEQAEVKAESKDEVIETPKAEEKQEKPKKEEAKAEEPKEEKPVETAKEEEANKEEAKEETPKEEKPEEPKPEEKKAEEEQPEAKAEKAEEAPTAEEKVEEPKYEKKEYDYEVEGDKEDEIDLGKVEETAQLTTKERNALPDNMFAVVVTVKNKKTGKPRKIRMFPINDEAHVRNALARLGQPAPQATLKRLGVSVEAVRAKILRRAKQLKMTQLIERYKKGIRKAVKKYSELRKAMDEKIEFYKRNAKTIIERRTEVGEYKITDEELLNDDKFALAKAEIENASLRAEREDGSEVLGSKASQRDDGWYAEKRRKIDEQAFPKK